MPHPSLCMAGFLQPSQFCTNEGHTSVQRPPAGQPVTTELRCRQQNLHQPLKQSRTPVCMCCVVYFAFQEVRAYEDKFYTPLGAARHGFLDDIIRPSETRQRLIRELRLLKRKNIQRPWKKHGNIPL